MNNETKGNIIFNLHVFTLCLSFILPVILPRKYLWIGPIYIILLILHWAIFGGCILSILEKKYLNEEYSPDYKGGFLDKTMKTYLNIDITEKQLFWTSTFLVMWQSIIYIFRYTLNIELTMFVNLVFFYFLINYSM
jgi:hypothetical protein